MQVRLRVDVKVSDHDWRKLNQIIVALSIFWLFSLGIL
jgi:hypothetical protein